MIKSDAQYFYIGLIFYDLVSDVNVYFIIRPLLVENYKGLFFFWGETEDGCFWQGHEFIRRILKYPLDRINVFTAAKNK